MDDQLLLGESQARRSRDADLPAPGHRPRRVSAFWNQVAPAPQSRAKPAGFDAQNADDPRYAWARWTAWWAPPCATA